MKLRLTDDEASILNGYLNDVNYSPMKEILGPNAKRGLTRIRKKLQIEMDRNPRFLRLRREE